MADLMHLHDDSGYTGQEVVPAGLGTAMDSGYTLDVLGGRSRQGQ